MHVVVHVLASDDWCRSAGVLTLNALRFVPVTSLLGRKLTLHLIVVVVFVGAVLNRDHVVVVLLRELCLVVDRLDRGVVVVLVNLLVDRRLHVLVFSAVDGLVSDGRGNLLVDGGVVMAGLGPAANVSRLDFSDLRTSRT